MHLRENASSPGCDAVQSVTQSLCSLRNARANPHGIRDFSRGYRNGSNNLLVASDGVNEVLALFLLVVAVVLAEEKYTTKYDNIDLDTILTSERLLKNYVNCLLDKGSCTPDGKELKEILPDALMTECHKCSEKQKKGTEKVVRYLVNKKPETWEQLKKKYDSTGEYSIKYTDEAHKQGINV
ncbi:PEB3 protein, partial [Pseudoatta argentina]